GSGRIGDTDILVILTAWGSCPGCAEDLDCDERVGFDEVLQVISNWGPCGE
ncbi:MAG: hypothetical protein HKO98_03635, partial [Gemmatimonadetes bacterium]|nr:hypothetical protein [Gemmatimonadota bacterium]